MKIEKISRGLYQIIGDSAKELGMAFLRIQEYYESVKFKGKIFSVDEFKEWWVKKSSLGKNAGRFSYCRYFDGFNIPSKALKPFYEGKFNPLTKWEEMLLTQLEKIREKKFYIIGTRKKADTSILKHEIAHSFFSKFPEYRVKVRRALNKLDSKSKKKLDKYLKEIDYHPSVFEDERHAYLLAGHRELKTEAKISIDKIQPVSMALNKIYSSTLKMI